jgi:hypothetical protein
MGEAGTVIWRNPGPCWAKQVAANGMSNVKKTTSPRAFAQLVRMNARLLIILSVEAIQGSEKETNEF